MSPVASLVAVHEELDRVFARFRELVLIGDGARAAAVLAIYGALTATLGALTLSASTLPPPTAYVGATLSRFRSTTHIKGRIVAPSLRGTIRRIE